MFYETLPYYLALGMSAEEFWSGNPYLAVAYRKLGEIQKEQRNQDMWWQGAYIFEALSIALYNSFGGKKPKSYLEKPYKVTQDTEEEKRAKAKIEREKIANYFTNLKKNWDKKNGR